VLHFVRYRRDALPELLEAINATGYGLTLGVHTRIDETIAQVVATGRAGNVYVNRNMVGAVVGVQPFGGEGLSGTGPKAGGPLYLYRLLARRPGDVMARVLGDSHQVDAARDEPLRALEQWARRDPARARVAEACARFAQVSRSGVSEALPGPTGESNTYTLKPRGAVLCLAQDGQDRLVQLAAVLAVGSRAVWAASAQGLSLPAEVRSRIKIAPDGRGVDVAFDACIFHGTPAALEALCRELAQRPGPIVNVEAYRPGATAIALERLLTERSVSVNTAAAGGNASLMTIS
jgi:RHH-type proline utilization regulon transcriptional repressor/proline dehydrogenase/delta 1-pyrroline-5-carboxylate dehydrogenase